MAPKTTEILDKSKEAMSSKTILPRHFKLVRRYLRYFTVPSTYPGDKSDLFQVGVLGILKALDTFDDTKSSFSTWSWYWVRSFIRDEISKHQTSGYIDYINNGNPDKRLLLKELHHLIDNKKDKEVYIMYLGGMTTTDIGKHWGVTRQTIDHRLQRLHNNIKEKVNGI